LITTESWLQFDLDEDFAYVASRNSPPSEDMASRVPLDGGAPVVLATMQSLCNGIRVSERAVYWVEGDDENCTHPKLQHVDK